MILSAQDIQSQQFHVRFRGFDVEEVDDFLEKISAAYQTVFEENQKLKGRLETMEKDLATYQNQQKSFQSAIIAAQNVSDGMKEKSREEAEAIVAEAEEEARLRREEADQEIAELKGKIGDLKSLREQARDDMRLQLKSYLQLLETEPTDTERAVEHFSSPPRRQEPLRDKAYGAVPRSPVMAEPEIAPQPQSDSLVFSEEADDLADLYVKIDIPDSSPGSMAVAANDDADSMLPDLDGDMVFNLEDPLAHREPSVSFAESMEEAKHKRSDRFDPDESPL